MKLFFVVFPSLISCYSGQVKKKNEPIPLRDDVKTSAVHAAVLHFYEGRTRTIYAVTSESAAGAHSGEVGRGTLLYDTYSRRRLKEICLLA